MFCVSPFQLLLLLLFLGGYIAVVVGVGVAVYFVTRKGNGGE